MIHRYIVKRRVRIIVGLVLAVGLVAQCYRALSARMDGGFEAVPRAAAARPAHNQAFAALSPRDTTFALSLEELAARDPVAFLEMALDHYDRSVRDYTCTFTKQEIVSGRLTQKQVMEVHYRENPYSVRMKWVQNPDKCSRVLYVADRWVKNGEQFAVVEPGAIAKLFVPYVMRPIHGEDARKSSRRTIDQFGLRNSMALTLKYCKQARQQNVLDFTYKGNGKVADRDTLIFERHLPFNGDEGLWPDRVLVVHLDKELLVPTLCTAYADDAKTKLLGEYQVTDIKLNQNLPESIFTKEGMGL